MLSLTVLLTTPLILSDSVAYSPDQCGSVQFCRDYAFHSLLLLKQLKHVIYSICVSLLENSSSNPETLAEHLKSLIITKGPLSVSEFTKIALTHPTLGFYHNCDVIGKEQSHFITSPEINQAFGELLGIWCVTQWEGFGKPQKMQLVELGPGRGTLMKDLLRAVRHFPDLYYNLDIHLVELSPGMRSKQKYALDCKWNLCGDVNIDLLSIQNLSM